MTLCERIALAAAMVASLSVAGCGGSDFTPPETPTIEDAQAALATTLDAWKSGDSIESLQQRQPPIHMSDHDWSASKQLKGYEIKGQPAIHGNKAKVEVNLLLQAASGPPKKAAAVYLVSTHPVISVVRSDIAE